MVQFSLEKSRLTWNNIEIPYIRGGVSHWVQVISNEWTYQQNNWQTGITKVLYQGPPKWFLKGMSPNHLTCNTDTATFYITDSESCSILPLNQIQKTKNICIWHTCSCQWICSSEKYTLKEFRYLMTSAYGGTCVSSEDL